MPLIVFANPRHPLAEGKHGKPIAKGDLSELAVFVSDPSGEFYELIENFLSDAGMLIARIRSAGSIEGVKRGVRSDIRAVGILPAYAIQEEVRAGCVVRLDVSPAPPTLQLAAVLSLVQEPHPATTELIEDIRKLFSVRSQTA